MQNEIIRLFLPVAPMFERVMGYTGPQRWVGFYRSPLFDGFCWHDGRIFGFGAVGPQDAWARFVRHPQVLVYLAPFDFGSASKEPRHALLLDRAEREFHVLPFERSSAFLIRAATAPAAITATDADIVRVVHLLHDEASPSDPSALRTRFWPGHDGERPRAGHASLTEWYSATLHRFVAGAGGAPSHDPA